MRKNAIERMCREAGMRPECRQKLRDVEVYIADGFSLMPHNNWRRFGIDHNEFPEGMYITLWWISRAEEKLDIGRPIFFGAFHNPELDSASKKQARINAAIKDADDMLTARQKRIGKFH